MRSWANRPHSSLLASFLAASCLLVAGSPQELHEASGSRYFSYSDPKGKGPNCSFAASFSCYWLGPVGQRLNTLFMQYLMPFVEKEKYELPSKCRLRPENDMFREQEQHKIHFDVNEWRCGFCKKSFRAEKFIDQHFANRHNNLLDNTQGRCLADLCEALHCDLTMEFKKPKSKCNAAAAARNRHLCENLADSCFPINQGHSASRLHETNKQILPGSLHLDDAAFACVLSHSIFTPEGNEERRSSFQTNWKNRAQEKAVLVVRSLATC
ncbi:unnamed protein product [Triticum turgidum subsp. durum]|uniref:C2H2-type domain-containing protein n=1 Tax=Triticum turgidum subsp. durum TaxID=4567 RepID=A0A9R1AL49_TRITD|nr:unnamed protein product [Triticum turgidum subsp. durum]